MNTRHDDPERPPPFHLDSPVQTNPEAWIQDSQSLKDVLRNGADRALIFVSNASSETLGACLVGFGATTYFVFGRVGLVLIGFVGGVVWHATWDNGNGGSQDAESRLRETARRREVGADVVQRVLTWRNKRAPAGLDNEEKDGLRVSVGQPTALDYSHFKPETASALNALTDAVVRDYVKYASGCKSWK